MASHQDPPSLSTPSRFPSCKGVCFCFSQPAVMSGTDVNRGVGTVKGGGHAMARWAGSGFATHPLSGLQSMPCSRSPAHRVPRAPSPAVRGVTHVKFF
jgi:hypothetical protein